MKLTLSVVPVHPTGAVFVADTAAVDAVRHQVSTHFRGCPDRHFAHALLDGPGDLSRCHTQSFVRHDHECRRVAVQDHADWSTAGSETAVHCLGQIVHSLLDVLWRRPTMI